MRMPRVSAVLLASLVAGGVVWAQVGRGGSEWLTAQGDAQRTSWIRTDPKISIETMSKPGFELQWTSKVSNQTRQLNGLSQGVTANGVTLFVPMSIVTGSSNNVYALDNDTGYVVWQRHFDAPLPQATAACAGGITAAATRIVSVTPPPIGAAPAGRAAGRGAVGYRSLLGEPGEGVAVEVRGGGPGRAAGPPAPGAAPAGPAGRPGGAPAPAPGPGGPGFGGRGNQGNAGIPGAPEGGGPGGGLGRPSGVVYAVSSDGMLHVLGLQSGKDIQQPAPFLPPNARWSDAVAVGTTLYTATSGGCGGSPNGVWAIDLDSATKPVVSWKTNGGSVIGRVAFAANGTVLVAIGPGQKAADGYANAIVALDPKTLQVKDWFTQPSTEFVTGPMVFSHNDTELVAAGTKDGRILLLNSASLGGATHSTPIHASRQLTTGGATFAADALATWQQATITPAPAPAVAGAPAAPPTVTLGTRWILAPVAGRLPARVEATNGAVAAGAVIALTLVDVGPLSLEPAWVSHDLVTPATPIVVNGVVFALSTGRPAGSGGRGTPAVLHAYDGATGRPLWSSEKTMTAFASPQSFWSALGQAYVGTNDGTVYAFGFLDERR